MSLSSTFIIVLIALGMNTINVCNGARILAVVAVPSFSHQVFFRPLWREYLRRGHELTLITTDPMPKEDHHQNLRQIDVSAVYDAADAKFQRLLDLRNDKFAEMNFLFEYVLNATRRELQHPEVLELFTNPAIVFDLLLVEDLAATMYVFKHRFDVPCIALASFDVPPWTHEYVGNPIHPLLYPHAMIPSDIVPEGMLTRFVTVVFDFAVRQYYEIMLVSQMDKVVAETLPGHFPSILELQQRVDMLFTNANPVFASVRPYAPTTISLAGGFHTDRPQNISKELLEFLDNATEGVIYFSLGTNVKSKLLPANLLNIFLETFRQLPFKVLLKFAGDTIENQPDNVRIVKWCPQQAVLRHPNLRAFINQGGLQSLEEALLSGVPVVTMPFFFDQEANAKRVVANGIGVEVRYETLTLGQLKAAILEVANNVKYKKMAEKHSKRILDRPMSPLELAIWNTEYLLRHKDVTHLKTQKIPNYQYYYLDVFAIIVVLLSVLMYIAYCLLLKILNILIDNLLMQKTRVVIRVKSE